MSGIFEVCSKNECGISFEEACDRIHAEAAGRLVLCALSGGVDSAVCAVLAHRVREVKRD